MLDIRSVLDLVDEWILHLEAGGTPEKTRAVYRSMVGRFLAFIETLPAPANRYDSIGHKVVEAWLLHLKKVEGQQARSINSKLSALRGFYRYAKREGYVADNPAVDVRMMRTPRLLPKPFTQAEISAILAATTDPQEKALFETYYSTGCRTGEMATMRVGDLDLNGARILVFGKGQKERFVPLGEFATAALGHYLELRRTNGERLTSASPLWVHRWRGRLWPMRDRQMRERLRLAAARAGVVGKKNPHRFRHSFCTDLLEGGADIREVQELAGHDSIQTTTIYTQVATARKFEAWKNAHPRAKVKGTVEERRVDP